MSQVVFCPKRARPDKMKARIGADSYILTAGRLFGPTSDYHDVTLMLDTAASLTMIRGAALAQERMQQAAVSAEGGDAEPG